MTDGDIGCYRVKRDIVLQGWCHRIKYSEWEGFHEGRL